jgi:hypothetical protein
MGAATPGCHPHFISKLQFFQAQLVFVSGASRAKLKNGVRSNFP